jgi:hypothetical protein
MSEWLRVSKAHPCPVCKKITWCLIGDKNILCMRAASNRPIALKSGETGWLHSLDAPIVLPQPQEPRKPEPKVDCRALMARWYDETKPATFTLLGLDLGVEQWTLGKFGLGCCYAQCHNAWAFPMWDGLGHMVGIRLRSMAGKKWTVTGTHAGIFVPMVNPQPTLVICEGPTDTAAALSMGYYAVGRPSCSGGAPMIKELIARTAVRRAIVIADNDDPGLNGARSLISNLQVPACIITLPGKDLRRFYCDGGDHETINALARSSVWHHRAFHT